MHIRVEKIYIYIPNRPVLLVTGTVALQAGVAEGVYEKYIHTKYACIHIYIICNYKLQTHTYMLSYVCTTYDFGS